MANASSESTVNLQHLAACGCFAASEYALGMPFICFNGCFWQACGCVFVSCFTFVFQIFFGRIFCDWCFLPQCFQQTFGFLLASLKTKTARRICSLTFSLKRTVESLPSRLLHLGFPGTGSTAMEGAYIDHWGSAWQICYQLAAAGSSWQLCKVNGLEGFKALNASAMRWRCTWKEHWGEKGNLNMNRQKASRSKNSVTGRNDGFPRLACTGWKRLQSACLRQKVCQLLGYWFT